MTLPFSRFRANLFNTSSAASSAVGQPRTSKKRTKFFRKAKYLLLTVSLFAANELIGLSKELAGSRKSFPLGDRIKSELRNAYGWYGMLLAGEKRFNEAETELRKAEQLDPTSLNIAVYLTANFYYSRQFDRAIEQSRKELELEPRLTAAYLYLSQSFEQKQMYDKAVEADLERQKIIAPETVEPLREAFLISGIKGFWRKQIEVQKEQTIKFSSCPYEIATRYTLLNERSDSLKIIEESSLYGGTCWNAVKVEPAFDSLQKEPRFQEILQKMFLRSF